MTVSAELAGRKIGLWSGKGLELMPLGCRPSGSDDDIFFPGLGIGP